MTAALDLNGLTVRLNGREVVRQASFTLPRGRLMALIGPNGAGKTSLLRAVAGAATGDWQGGIAIAGRDQRTLTPGQRARMVAYLPQQRDIAWGLAVRDVVALGRLPHGSFGRGETAEDAAAVERAMLAADVAALRRRRVDRLSGGERARVLLARAVAQAAPLLLVDEPTAALDPYHQLQVMELLRAEADAGGAVVAVLHDLALAARFAHLVALMDEGRIVACGPPGEVLTPTAMAAVYRVDPLAGVHEGAPWIIPWRRI